MYKILAINPGSTSTKFGVFEDEKLIKEYKVVHTAEELKQYPSMELEALYRKTLIEEMLKKDKIDLASFSAYSCRGGILKPIESGTYFVDDNVLYDSLHSPVDHPSNLGSLIGDALSKQYGPTAYITDPPSTFEAPKIATISGLPQIERKLRCHALNHKAIAKEHCKEKHLDYNKVNLLVAHIGGGISVGIHHNGKIIDITDATGEGSFSPERAGSLPVLQFADLCFSGKYTHKEVRKLLVGNGGFTAYLQTNDVKEIIRRAQSGDENAKLYFDAFVYQIAKDVGAMATVVNGKVDAILLTGGICHSQYFTDCLLARIKWIAPCFIYPGEEELQALNHGVLAVLKGKEKAKTY